MSEPKNGRWVRRRSSQGTCERVRKERKTRPGLVTLLIEVRSPFAPGFWDVTPRWDRDEFALWVLHHAGNVVNFVFRVLHHVRIATNLCILSATPRWNRDQFCFLVLQEARIAMKNRVDTQDGMNGVGSGPLPLPPGAEERMLPARGEIARWHKTRLTRSKNTTTHLARTKRQTKRHHILCTTPAKAQHKTCYPKASLGTGDVRYKKSAFK